MYAQVAKDPWLAQTNKFQVHEKIQTGFLRFVIDSKLGSVPVRGNLGVQYVDSEQNSDGFAWNDGAGTPAGGAVIPVSGGTTYSDVLPSLNLVFDLQEDLLLRFGLGKTMARPRMDDMRAGADQPVLTPISPASDETIGTWSAGGGGKPDLQPWRAKSVDLSLEKYFQTAQLRRGRRIPEETGQLHLPAQQRARLHRVPQLQPGSHARLLCDRAGLQSEPRLDHHAGQWQRRQGLRRRVVDLSGRWPVHARAGRFRRATEWSENVRRSAEGRERRRDQTRRLLRQRQQHRGVFREERFLGPGQPPLSLGVYGHHAQRDI